MATIRGTAPDEYLSFTPLPEISRHSFEVTACLRDRVVTNNSLTLLAGEAFLAALREFERTRSGEARLEGTYDFQLAITPHGRTGAAWVGFCLKEFVYLSNGQDGRHVLEGGFKVEGEHVGHMVRELAGLLAGRAAGEQPV